MDLTVADKSFFTEHCFSHPELNVMCTFIPENVKTGSRGTRSAVIPVFIIVNEPTFKFNMKKFLLFVFCVSAILSKGFAQLKFQPADLTYHSDYEKQAIAQIDLSAPADPRKMLALLLAGDPENGEKELQQASKKLNEIIQSLEKEGIADKKLKKSTRLIFDQVHSNLRLYDEYAVFDQIFESGTYNCLTASALYAFILEHFKIPYVFVEMPTHVFVLVDPGGENIGMETTNPTEGVFKLDKAKIVDELRRKKMVAVSDLQNKTADEVYDTYFKDSQISIGFYQLAGLAYYNLAVYQFEKKEYQSAVALSEKSLFFYPDSERGEIRKLALTQILTTAGSESPQDLWAFFALFDYPEVQKTLREQLPKIYEETAQLHLISEYSQEKYDSFYHYFIQQLSRKNESVKDIQFLHHYYTGINLGLRQDYKKSVVALDSAYQIKSGSLKLQGLLAEGIMMSLNSERYRTEFPDTDSLFARYPFLKTIDNFVKIHCYKKTRPIVDIWEENKEKEGVAAVEAYQAKMMPLKPSVEFNTSIEIMYDAVFRYYVRKDDYKQCRLWLNKGLELVPDSESLKHNLETVNNHVKIYGEEPLKIKTVKKYR